jgi:protein XagA
MDMRNVGFTFLVIFFSFTSILGQVQEPRQGWIKVSQQFISSNSYFDPDEVAATIRTNSLYLTNLSAEYGITDRLTATAFFPVFVRSVINETQFNQTGDIVPGSSLNSVGDAEIGLKVSIRKQSPIQIMVFGTLGLPLGKKGKVGLDTDLQTGDGEFNQLIGVQLRQVFSSFHIQGYTSYNNRSKDFSNEIRYGFEVGYTNNKLMFTANFNAIESLFNDTAPTSQNGIFSNHREVFSPRVKIQYLISPKIEVFSSADFIVAGRNTLNAPLFEAGIQLNKGK